MKKFLKENNIYKFFDSRFNQLSIGLNKNEIVCAESIKELKIKILEIQDYQDTMLKIINEQNKTLTDLKIQQENINAKLLQFEFINTELLTISSTNKRKILVVGFYGAPNTGDELMLQSILQYLNLEKYEVTVMLTDNVNYYVKGYTNIKFIHYPKTNMDLNIISHYFDKIIFGGGALLDDSNYSNFSAYKFDVANILIDLSITAINNEKDVYCIALSSIEKISNHQYIENLSIIIENAKYFSLRDTNSLNSLISSGVKHTKKVKIDNDLVYALPHIKYKMTQSDKCNIGIILIGQADKEKLKLILQSVDEFLKSNLNIENKEIVLIPFYDYNNSDVLEYQSIIKNTKIFSKIKVEKYTNNYDTLMKLFNECTMIISMRYHASLLALKNNIPSIHIIYDTHCHYNNKMQYLIKNYECNERVLLFSNLIKDDLMYYLKSCYSDRTKIVEKCAIKSMVLESETKAQMEKNFQMINEV